MSAQPISPPITPPTVTSMNALRHLPEDIQTDCAKWGDDTVETLVKLARLARTNEWSQAQTAAQIMRNNGPLDNATLGKVLAGKYPSNPQLIIADIEKFLAKFQQDSTADICVTTLGLRIAGVCSLATATHKNAFIYGITQQGKTVALKGVLANLSTEHGAYYRVPAGGTFLMAIKALAKTLGCRKKANSNAELRDAIFSVTKSNFLIVVDEAHQLFMTLRKGVAIKVLEFLRELHDETGCTIIFCGTQMLQQELTKGEFKDVLQQLVERTPLSVDLTTWKPLKKDFISLAKLHGFPEPDDEVTNVLKTLAKHHSFGRVCDYISAAKHIASKQKKPPTWPHLQKAISLIETINTGS